MQNDTLLISVDIETSGPIPGEYSMLALGACVVQQPATALYLELQPTSLRHDAQALAISGLNLQHLQQHGLPPPQAMQTLADWLQTVCPPPDKPVCVALNAPFDWAFINYYFHKYLGHNPFGFSALDLKAYYMGATGCRWQDSTSSRMAAALRPHSQPDHNALQDARFQAELMRLMLAQRGNP